MNHRQHIQMLVKDEKGETENNARTASAIDKNETRKPAHTHTRTLKWGRRLAILQIINITKATKKNI